MAKGEATLILNIKRKGKKALIGTLKSFRNLGDRAQKATRPLKNLFSSLTKIGGAAFRVVGPIAAVGAAMFNLALKGDKLKQVRTAFENLAQSQNKNADDMLASMRKLSAGTVSDLSLMQQANNALLLGLPVDRFGEMLKIARSSAKATGQSMDFMLSSIVTGIGRSSKLMLDNLGIIVNTEQAYVKFAEANGLVASKLTDAQKKQAFLNEALRIGNENAEKAGAGTDSLTDKWERTKSKVVNLATAIGERLIPIFNTVLDVTNKILAASDEFLTPPKGIEALKKSLTELIVKNIELEEQIKSNANNEGIKASLQAVLDRNNEEIASIESLIKAHGAESQANRAKAEEKAILAEEERARLEEDNAIKAEMDEINKAEKLDREKAFQEALRNQQNAALMAIINDNIKNETNRDKKLALIAFKKEQRERLIDKQLREREQKTSDFKAFLKRKEVSDLSSTLGTISSLQSAKSKELVIIGKAAALAQITISTALGYVRALSLAPLIGPPAAAALGSLVLAAGAVGAAQVVGVSLAEGGIVPASPGGTIAQIAEAGKDEAVIPLDDEGAAEKLGGLGETHVHFHGPLLGNTEEAREFAMVIDRELLELRRGNESVSFEEDFI